MLTNTVNASSLLVDSVSKRVELETGSLQVLSDISFSVPAGGSCALVGRSGSGKTTLLGILAGLDNASSGSVKIDEINISSLSEDECAKLRKERVGFVFQSFHLLDHLTALQNVTLPLNLAGEQNAESKAQSFLERVGLAERANHLPKQLSGGEQQRVAIARAFACEPSILFADEPTGNLDSNTGHSVANLLFELNEEQGVTLILVTHDDELANRCTQKLTIDQGALVTHNEEV